MFRQAVKKAKQSAAAFRPRAGKPFTILDRVGDLTQRFVLSGKTRGAFFVILAAFLLQGVIYNRAPSEGRDYWAHVSAIRAFSENLLSPGPLYFNEAYQHALYTPYHWVWGAVLSLGIVDLWTVLAFAAAFNIFLFLLACRLIASRIFNEPRLDMLVCATLLFLWGSLLLWSGVYSINQLPVQSLFASYFALSVSLCAFAIFPTGRSLKPKEWALTTLTVCLVFLSHPVTASIFLIMLAAKLIVLANEWCWKRLIIAGSAMIAGLALSLAWPFYSVLQIIFSGGVGSADFFGKDAPLYRAPIQKIGLAAFGALALYYFRSSKAIRLFAVLILVFLAFYGANYFFHISPIFARYIIYVILALQLGAVAVVWELSTTKSRKTTLLLFLFLLFTPGFVHLQTNVYGHSGLYADRQASQPLGSSHARHEYALIRNFPFTETAARPVVLAPDKLGFLVTALTDAKLMVTGYYVPTVKTFAERKEDAETFFDVTTSCAQRAVITQKWGVTHLLLRHANADISNAAQHCGWKIAAEDHAFQILAAPTTP